MNRARTCEDCYFRHKELCALLRTDPCPTFRLARQGRMTSAKQAQLVERTDRGRIAAGALASA